MSEKKFRWEIRKNLTTGRPYGVRVLRPIGGQPPGMDELPPSGVRGQLLNKKPSVLRRPKNPNFKPPTGGVPSGDLKD